MPTCMDDGYYAACGVAFDEDPNNHAGPVTSITPNCLGSSHCDSCDQYFGDKDPNNHDGHMAEVKAVPANCTEPGTAAHWECSNCKKLYSDRDAKNETTLKALKTEPLGHDWGEWTLNAGGTGYTRSCKRDGCGAKETAVCAVTVKPKPSDELTQDQKAAQEKAQEELKQETAEKAKEAEKAAGKVDTRTESGQVLADLMSGKNDEGSKSQEEQQATQAAALEVKEDIEKSGLEVSDLTADEIKAAVENKEQEKQDAAVEKVFNELSADLADANEGKGVVISVVLPKMTPKLDGFYPLRVNHRHLIHGQRLRFWPSVRYFLQHAQGGASVSLAAEGKEGQYFFLDQNGVPTTVVSGDTAQMTAVAFLTAAGGPYEDAFITADATEKDQATLMELKEKAIGSDPTAPISDKDSGCDSLSGGLALLALVGLAARKRK